MHFMKVFERWVKPLDVLEYLNTLIDIPFTYRGIDKGNYIVDFAFLESSYEDVVMGPVVRVCTQYHFLQNASFPGRLALNLHHGYRNHLVDLYVKLPTFWFPGDKNR